MLICLNWSRSFEMISNIVKILFYLLSIFCFFTNKFYFIRHIFLSLNYNVQNVHWYCNGQHVHLKCGVLWVPVLSGQFKDYKIGICYFSAKHAALRSNSKYWLAWNQDDVSQWMVMVFNPTFNNISVKSWWSALLVEETGIPGENHRHDKLYHM